MRDRYLAPDIEAATAMITDGTIAAALRTLPQRPALWDPV